MLYCVIRPYIYANRRNPQPNEKNKIKLHNNFTNILNAECYYNIIYYVGTPRESENIAMVTQTSCHNIYT